MPVTFPRKLLREHDHDWNIIGNTAGSGQTSSVAAVIRSDGGGFWAASLNNIQFLDRSDTLLWRAIRQLCNGGVSPIVVPRNDIAFAPFPFGALPMDAIPHSDGALFSDGGGYAQPIINVTCNGGAALRAVSMNVNLIVCADLQGGEAFSIEHPTFGWRMYEIATVSPVSDGVVAITFNPPLREAIVDGEQIEFDMPRCTMRLADPKAMDLNVTTWPFSIASVKFIETKYG